MKIQRPKSAQPTPDHAQKVFKGKVFDVYQWEQELFDGTKQIFEKIRRPDTVVVFPILDDGKILLLEQEQPGLQPFISATGGRVDEGEDVIDAAKRELLEETGYEANEFILWDAQQPVTKIEWAVYTFIAKGLKKVSEPDLDGGEKVRFKPVTLDELIEIGTSKDSGKNFSEKEIISKLFEARLYPEKMNELKKLFDPKS